MGLVVLAGSLVMGAMLVVGSRWFPGFTVMWFASPEAHAEAWRQLLIVGLIMFAVVRAYFDNIYSHLLWAAVAAGLLWGGVEYFLNNPAYIFDTLFVMSSGICFAIAAIQKIPIEFPSDAKQPARAKARDLYAWIKKLRNPVPSFRRLTYLRDIKDDSHILMLRQSISIHKNVFSG